MFLETNLHIYVVSIRILLFEKNGILILLILFSEKA